MTPLKVGEALYVCTGSNDVLSLNPETGAVNWRFNAHANMTGLVAPACRGVAYYRALGLSGTCAERIITNTVDARLIALDAHTGARCQDFGVNGETSLQTGLGPSPPGYYYVSSAPTIVSGKIILGGCSGSGSTKARRLSWRGSQTMDDPILAQAGDRDVSSGPVSGS